MAKGLGRGLSSLLKNNSPTQNESVNNFTDSQESTNNNSFGLNNSNATDNCLIEIDIDKLQRGVGQPRQFIDQDGLNELAVSIKRSGLIQPITVRKISDDKFEIIAGERRWHAAKIAGMNKIPCIIKDVSDDEVLVMSLIENIQREDLNVIEEAEALQRLVKELNLTHAELAEKVGKSRTQISNLLRLNELNSKVKDFVKSNELEMGHARALLPLPLEQQEKIALAVIQKGLTVRETENLVKSLATPKAQPKAFENNEDALQIKDYLNTKLEGLSVKFVQSGKDKGKLILSYKTLEELDKIKKLFNL